MIGQEFESELLKSFSDLPVERLPDLLEEAATAGIIVSLDGSRYRFSHPLIREALYNESGAAERIALHRRIGDALEEMSSDSPSSSIPAFGSFWCYAEIFAHWVPNRFSDRPAHRL